MRAPMQRSLPRLLPRRLDLQLALLFAFLFAASIAVYAKYTGEGQYDAAVNFLRQQALRWTLETANEGAAEVAVGDRAALRERLGHMAKSAEAGRFTVFGADGQPLVAMEISHGETEAREAVSPAGVLPPATAVATARVNDDPPSGNRSARRIDAWAPVLREGKHVGWLHGEFDTRKAEQMRGQVFADSLLAGMVMLLSATMLVFVFLRAPMASVRRAREFASQLDAGFGTEVDFSTAPTEIRKLGEALNRASRRLAQQNAALIEGERRKGVILDAALDAIVAIDAAGKVTEFNPSAERLFDYRRDEVVGRPLAETLGSSAQRDSVKEALTDFAAAGEKEMFVPRRELTGRRRDGGKFVAEVAFAAIDSAGELTYIAYLRDISKRRQAQEKLEDQLEFVKQLLDAIPAPIYVKDAAGRYLSVNRAWCEFMGIAADAVRGRAVGEVFSPEVASIHERKDAEMTGSEIQSYAVQVKRADGEARELLVSKARFSRSDGSVAGLIGVLTDISEQKRAEQAMRAARDAAEDANRAKSDFLANMSHEIRTPMNAVLGLTEIVLDGELEAEQREHLKMVKEAASSLLGIINEILDFSKIEAGRLEFESIGFSLRDVVGLAARTLARQAAEKGLELNVHVAPGVADACRGDPHRLRQVLTNLIGNALKFTERGEIEITVRGYGDDLVHFTVRDTGIGIPAEKQHQIFQAFEQADTSTTRRFGGTGLGLAICQRLVEAMEGMIWVESTPGLGSSFHFTARLPAQMEPAPTRPALDLSGRAVLVIEGHATSRRVLEGMLSAWGMQVLSVGTAAAGLDLVAPAISSSAPVELTIVGGNLPDMDAFGLVQELRARHDGDPRIMMLMAAGIQGDAKRCRELCVAAYLIKPVTEGELLDAVLLALDMPRGEPRDMVTRHTLREQHHASLRLLLAEDNPVNQMLAVRLLEKLGHSVRVVGDGAAAVAAVESERFDAVLMDLQMPVLGGFEATAQIRAGEGADQRLPIIAMTAHAMEGDRERCLVAGMDAYVSKPIHLPMLAAALDAVVSSDKPMVPAPDASPDAPLLRREELLRNLDGDQELLVQLVAMLRDELPAHREQLRAAMAASDPSRLRAVAHAIKGSVSNFGARPLVAALQSIETSAAGGDCASIDAALELLDRLAAELA